MKRRIPRFILLHASLAIEIVINILVLNAGLVIYIPKPIKVF